MDTIILDGKNAITNLPPIFSGDKVAIVQLKNGNKVAIPSESICEGTEVMILQLKNGDKLAVANYDHCIKVTSGVYITYGVSPGTSMDLGTFKFKWDGKGSIYLGKTCTDTASQIYIDDAIVISTEKGSITFGWLDNSHGNYYVPIPKDITPLFEKGKINSVNIKLNDIYGEAIELDSLYIVQVTE